MRAPAKARLHAASWAPGSRRSTCSSCRPPIASRRDGDESFAELKTISKRGVQVWLYGYGTCFRYGTFESNVTGLLKAEFAAEKRRDSARKITEAVHLKARCGHVIGGRRFG